MMAVLSTDGSKVRIRYYGKHNDVELYSLEKEGDSDYRDIYALVNGVLFSLLQAHQMNALPADLTQTKLVELLRAKTKANKHATFHKSHYEAIGLDPSMADELRSQFAERNKELNAMEQRRRADYEVRRKQYDAELVQRIADGTQISGSELRQAVLIFGITVPPRTAGVFNRIVHISEKGARALGAKLPESIWMLYGQLRQAALAKLRE